MIKSFSILTYLEIDITHGTINSIVLVFFFGFVFLHFLFRNECILHLSGNATGYTKFSTSIRLLQMLQRPLVYKLSVVVRVGA